METKTETIFYSVPSIDYAKIKTLNQLLDHIFPLLCGEIDNLNLKQSNYQTLLTSKIDFTPIADVKNNKLEINTHFLRELAYGIQCEKYFDPKRTFLMIVDKIRSIRKEAYLDNFSLFNACNFFLTHFIESTKTFSSSYEIKETVFNNPIILEEQFKAMCYAKKINTKKLMMTYTQALADDIFIMNSKAFLSLSIPIDPHHLLVDHFNKLVKLISEDLSIWLKCPVMSVFKIKVYLETAKKLLLLNDYHGAAAIEIAFQLQRDEIQQHDKYLTVIKQDLVALHELYSDKLNYQMLRRKMRTDLGIPFFSILCRDLDKANENKQIGDKIAIFGKLYFELAQEIRAVTEHIKILPCEYQTNLGTLMCLGLPITTKIPEELFIEEKPLMDKLRLSTRRVPLEEKVERKNSKEQKKLRPSIDENILEKKDSLPLNEQEKICNRRSTISNLGRFFSLSLTVSTDEEEDEEEKKLAI